MGMLEPGDQLPTAQQVVAKLAINPNTVHKAYRELERAGLARARPGLGTFITRSPSGTDPAMQARFLSEMTDWLRSARAAGQTARSARSGSRRRSSSVSTWPRAGSGWRGPR